jgi:hypothetical protein
MQRGGSCGRRPKSFHYPHSVSGLLIKTKTSDRIRLPGSIKVATLMTRPNGKDQTEPSRMTKENVQSHPSSSITASRSATRAAVDQLFSLLCLVHRAERSQELAELYWMGLSDLSQDQIAKLGTLVLKETNFWPSPGRLRELLGLPTAAELEEREAAEGLRSVLASLRPVARDPRRRDVWMAKAILMEDRIGRTLARFGSGDVECAVRVLCQHPTFAGRDAERESLGLELSAIEKLERRWLAAWKAVQS